MTNEIKFIIDETTGDLNIVSEDGQLLSADSKEVNYIRQYLFCEEIKSELLSRDDIRHNEELCRNISLIIKNYYTEAMAFMQQNRTSILRLALAASRDMIEIMEDEEAEYDEF